MKHRARILKILKENEKARDDDKLLTYLVFQEIAKENGQAIFIPFSLFNKFPAFETVKRTRAKIQNEENLYLPNSPLRKTEGGKFDRRLPSGDIKRKEIVEIPDIKERNSYLMA